MRRFTFSLLNAFANVGLLLVGLATLWTTLRVSGIENYFQSELALRNNELVTAERRLGDLDERAREALEDIEQAELRNRQLNDENKVLIEVRNDLSLLVEQLEIRAADLSQAVDSLEDELARAEYDVYRLQKEIARRDLQDRISRAYMRSAIEEDVEKEIVPVGENMFRYLMESYNRDPPPNHIAAGVVSLLPLECYGEIAAPLLLGKRQFASPLSRWTREDMFNPETHDEVNMSISRDREEQRQRLEKYTGEMRRVSEYLQNCGFALIEGQS